MLVDVVHVISSQLRELFFVLNDDIVAGDKVKAPCTQLRGIVELRIPGKYTSVSWSI